MAKNPWLEAARICRIRIVELSPKTITDEHIITSAILDELEILAETFDQMAQQYHIQEGSSSFVVKKSDLAH